MKKPNLIYVFADQWRYQAIGCNQQDQVITPNIDRFCEESINFTNAYSTFPLCSPHRGSLLTGKYPFTIGLWTNCKIGLEEKIMLKPQETSIANVLKENGYQTGYIGKWHLDSSEQNFEKNPKSGASNWDAYTPPGERRQGFDYWLSYGANDQHLNPHYWTDTCEKIFPNKWSVEFETDKAIEYIQQSKEDPFVLFLSYNPPHLPYELVPDRYYDKFKDMEMVYRDNVPKELRTEDLEKKSKQYFAAVYGVDEQFGRLLDYLKENEMEENTIVVLSADHGEMLGSQGLMQKNVWYEESIHIPLMIRQKNVISPKKSDVIFSSPDHMPTLLGIMGADIPETCQGYNHMNSIFGTDDMAPTDMFICSYPGMKEMVSKFEKKGLAHKSYGWRGVKTKTETYVVYNGYDPEEQQVEYYYDDETDPYQLNPKVIGAGCKEEKIVSIKNRLKHYLEITHDPFKWGN